MCPSRSFYLSTLWKECSSNAWYLYCIREWNINAKRTVMSFVIASKYFYISGAIILAAFHNVSMQMYLTYLYIGVIIHGYHNFLNNTLNIIKGNVREPTLSIMMFKLGDIVFFYALYLSRWIESCSFTARVKKPSSIAEFDIIIINIQY